jgi:hypothetical protein
MVLPMINALSRSKRKAIFLPSGDQAGAKSSLGLSVRRWTWPPWASILYFKSTGLRTLMIAPEGITRHVYPLYDTRTLSSYDVLNDRGPAMRAYLPGRAEPGIHRSCAPSGRRSKPHEADEGLVYW